MQSFAARLKQIEANILSDPTFKTLALHSTTIPYLNIRAEEIIKSNIIATQEKEIADIKQTLEAREAQHQKQQRETKQKQQQLQTEFLKKTQENKSICKKYEQLKKQYSNIMSKQNQQQELISHLKEEISLYKELENKASQQSAIISQQEDHIIQTNIKLQKQILMNQSLRRTKELLETQLQLLKQNQEKYFDNEKEKKNLERQNKMMKEELDKARAEVNKKGQQIYELQFKIVGLETAKRQIENDMDAIISDNKRMRDEGASSRIRKQKKQADFKKSEMFQQEIQKHIYNLTSEKKKLKKEKKSLRERISSLPDEMITLKSTFEMFKSQLTEKLSGMITLVATKFLTLSELCSIVGFRHSDQLSIVAQSHRSQLSSMKVSLTQKVLSNKRQLRHYMKEVSFKQNMVRESARELQREREQCSKKRVQSSRMMIEQLSKRLLFKEEIECVKMEHKKCRYMSGVKSKVEREDVRRGETTKKKSKESERQ